MPTPVVITTVVIAAISHKMIMTYVQFLEYLMYCYYYRFILSHHMFHENVHFILTTNWSLFHSQLCNGVLWNKQTTTTSSDTTISGEKSKDHHQNVTIDCNSKSNHKQNKFRIFEFLFRSFVDDANERCSHQLHKQNDCWSRNAQGMSGGRPIRGKAMAHDISRA